MVQSDPSSRKPELTAERLRELLHYDPQTGVFTRRISVGHRGRYKAGTVAKGRIGNHGYLVIGVNKHLYLAHRLAFLYMTGQWPEKYIDHISRNKTDNRWANLRQATKSQNSQNRAKPINNTSGARGVYWFKRDGTWQAQITMLGRKIHLGYFTDKADAIAARRAAELEHFGEFAPSRHGAAATNT